MEGNFSDDYLIPSSQSQTQENDNISSEDEDLLVASCQQAEESVEGMRRLRVERESFERFPEPKTDKEIEDLSKKTMPENTEKTIKWACRVFEDWRESRNSRIRNGGCVGQKLSIIDIKLEDLHDDELSFCLCRFLCETRKSDGSEYPPKTLRQLILLIQMHLNNQGRQVNFLSDVIFNELRNTLDNMMKAGARSGHGLQKRQADVISVEEEEKLWELGLLGDRSPQSLLDTMVFLMGLNFALRSGEEHRNLSTDQLRLERNASVELLRYTEKTSKNNQGGLKTFRVTPKSVCSYAAPRKERCIVYLYKKYMDLRPKEPTSFYLRPLTKPRADMWYSVAPIGQNTLSTTVRRLCQAAGMKGHYTNHSLRATCATRLFQSGVDEQLICKTTGHRSNAVREYKRVNDDQEEMISSIIQRGAKRAATSTPAATSTGPIEFTVTVKIPKSS